MFTLEFSFTKSTGLNSLLQENRWVPVFYTAPGKAIIGFSNGFPTRWKGDKDPETNQSVWGDLERHICNYISKSNHKCSHEVVELYNFCLNIKQSDSKKHSKAFYSMPGQTQQLHRDKH